MTAVVDSSALFAFLYEDDPHADAARAALESTYRRERLVVNEVVYTELAADPGLDGRGEVDRFLSDTGIDLDSPSRHALAAAGDAFRTYLSRRGDGHQCPECGSAVHATCETCGHEVTARQHPAPDFLIGGHAAVDAGTIVTFDEGFYRSYFDVEVRP